MISAWELYLWTRLDFFHGPINVIFIIFGILSAISAFACMTWGHEEDYPVEMKKPTYFLLTICVLWLFFVALLPTKKDAAMIWIVPQLATVENAELLKGEAAEIYKLAKQALTESIDIPEDTID